MNDNPVRLSEPERDRTAVDRLSLQVIEKNKLSDKSKFEKSIIYGDKAIITNKGAFPNF